MCVAVFPSGLLARQIVVYAEDNRGAEPLAGRPKNLLSNVYKSRLASSDCGIYEYQLPAIMSVYANQLKERPYENLCCFILAK